MNTDLSEAAQELLRLEFEQEALDAALALSEGIVLKTFGELADHLRTCPVPPELRVSRRSVISVGLAAWQGAQMTKQDDDDMTPLMHLGAAIAECGGQVPENGSEPLPFWNNRIGYVQSGVDGTHVPACCCRWCVSKRWNEKARK